MPIPKDKSIEIYLLHEIDQMGGSVRRSDPAIYQRLGLHFSAMTQSDLQLSDAASGTNKFQKHVEFAASRARKKGELDGGIRGVWSITQRGRDRLAKEWPPSEPPEYSTGLYIDRPRYKKPAVGRVVDRPSATAAYPAESQPSQPTAVSQPPAALSPAPTSIRDQVVDKLNTMNDRQFEDFVGRLLAELGYDDVEVVGRSGDGGVDVRCVLKAPLIEPPLTVVCQVKRHASNIGPSAVGDLRGRWAHRADRLILVNTAGFTQGAREAATEPGAKEIGLITGEDLADLMIEKGIGVHKEPVVEEKLDETFFEEFSS